VSIKTLSYLEKTCYPYEAEPAMDYLKYCASIGLNQFLFRAVMKRCGKHASAGTNKIIMLNMLEVLSIRDVSQLPIGFSYNNLGRMLSVSSKTSRNTVQSLIKKGDFVEIKMTDVEAATFLTNNIASSDAMEPCEWCKTETLAIEQHHYPIRKRDGGNDLVSICASCHRTFHLLTDFGVYRPSQKFFKWLLSLDFTTYAEKTHPASEGYADYLKLQAKKAEVYRQSILSRMIAQERA